MNYKSLIFDFAKPLIIAMILMVPTVSGAASFQGHTEFEAVRLEGRLYVTCNDGRDRDYQVHYCQGVVLDPGEYAYFSHDSGVDADQVNLYNTYQNGDDVSKKLWWDKEKSQTKSRVNLWIATLTQKPLLDYGINNIRYKFKKEGEKLEEGQFEVRVNSGNKRLCQSRSRHSRNMSDCRSSGLVCESYFRSQNYCQ